MHFAHIALFSICIVCRAVQKFKMKKEKVCAFPGLSLSLFVLLVLRRTLRHRGTDGVKEVLQRPTRYLAILRKSPKVDGQENKQI